MSRSNNENLVSPCKHYLSWKGEKSFKKVKGKIEETDKHSFFYYDKEKKEQVEVPLPVTFLVLDVLHTIKGYSEADKAGFYSNEIKTTMFNTHPFKVRLGKFDFAEGLYKDIKDSLKAKGGKYCQSVYILMKEGDEWVINNIQIMGAALENWMNFCKANDVEKGGVIVKEWSVGKKGTNEFNCPVFHAIPVSEATNKIAIEEDKLLQEYLKAYFAKTQDKIIEKKVENEVIQHVEDEKKYASSPEDLDIQNEEDLMPF
jgi:hypothetical protein